MNDNKKVLEWFNNFTDYIQNNNTNLYNQACKYADDIEQLFTEQNQNYKTMIEYILNPFILVNFGYMITAIIITLIIKKKNK